MEQREAAPVSLLAWIGRQRAVAVALLVVAAILTPPLGAILKPYLTEAVVGLLCIAFLRIDVTAFHDHVRRPHLVLAASAWTMIVIPVLFAIGSRLAGVDDVGPALFTGLMLQAVASPMMAAPALAVLMGLDGTLVLVTLCVSTVVTPLSAPFLAALFGVDLALSPTALGLKLLAILAGSAVAGLALRKVIGGERVVRFRDEIDGINIIVMFVFVSAAMGDVGTVFLERPLLMGGLVVLAFVVFAALLIVTSVVFAVCGAKRAFALGMMTSQRNMGLMIAGLGGAVPELTWLYFAAGQFPIYLSPLLLRPVARFVDRGSAGGQS